MKTHSTHLFVPLEYSALPSASRLLNPCPNGSLEVIVAISNDSLMSYLHMKNGKILTEAQR